MVLHMLRKKIGDINFFQGVKNYLNDANHAYGYAKTEDFIPIMEAASGENLTEFFNDWLYNQGYPSYSILWNQPSANQVHVQVSQIQSDGSVSYFEAPIPIRIIGTLGETIDIVLNNTVNQEVFSNSVNFTVASIELDPEADLISKNNSVVVTSNNLDINRSFKIFPNPANSELTLVKPDTLEVSEILIFNALGQLLYQSYWSPIISVKSFSSGILFMKLHTNEGVINKSVLKN